MTTVWEKQTIDRVQSEEARKHNEMIRENYRLLQNAEEEQLSKAFAEAESEKSFAARQNAAPVRMPEEKLSAAAESVKSVPLTAQQKELFTADTFRRVMGNGEVVSMPRETVEKTLAPVRETVARPVAAPVYEPKKEEIVKVEAETVKETYSLTNAAKALIAAFAAFAVLMLTLIGINTQILNAKGVRLAQLETQKQELVERTRELAERIENAVDEETIANWAAENGWTK